MTAPRPQRDLGNTRVSVVLPVYNEASVLVELRDRLTDVLESSVPNHELIFVDDGSTDGSADKLAQLAECDSRILVLRLSRNFGHQAALQAGLAHASGDVVIVMDSDLQDDPAAIPLLLKQWLGGYDVVYAIRTARKENIFKRSLFYAFYRILNVLSETPIPMDAGNFGLMDRRVADQIRDLRDQDRFLPGLRSWVGFRQTGIPIERQARHDNRPRVSLWGLFRLAKSALFSFSKTPLTFFYVIAVSATVAGLGLSCFVLYHKLISGLAVPGWASTSLIACFFGALNALGIAVLGEYVVRIYDQVRSRPLYVIAEERNDHDATRSQPSESRPAAREGIADNARVNLHSGPVVDVCSIQESVPVAES